MSSRIATIQSPTSYVDIDFSVALVCWNRDSDTWTGKLVFLSPCCDEVNYSCWIAMDATVPYRSHFTFQKGDRPGCKGQLSQSFYLPWTNSWPFGTTTLKTQYRYLFSMLASTLDWYQHKDATIITGMGINVLTMTIDHRWCQPEYDLLILPDTHSRLWERLPEE